MRARPKRGDVFLFDRLYIICVLGVMLSDSTTASAEPLPSVDDLKTQMGSDPVVVEVFEPHLSVGQNHIAVEYVGYPAETVLSVVLGQDWRDQGDAIEFRALDGYVSRIEMAKFEPEKAFVVFSREDQANFIVDNIAQSQKNVPLGPYYLVWDNISNSDLLAEGAGNWPYQVSDVLPFTVSDDALLPTGLEARYRRGAALAKMHCLNCHRINGYGGDKFEGDLAAITKGLARAYFVGWVLDPSSIRSGTTMPALPAQMGEAERVQTATALYDYLTHMPAPE